MKDFQLLLTKLIGDSKQCDIAGALGVSDSFLCDLLKGRREPSPDMVDKVADSFKLNKRERKVLHHAAAKDRGYDV